MTSISRGGVNWTYTYNNGDLLTREKLQLDGRTYQFDYAYDGEGDLVSATVPWAGTVIYNPDGFGRATGLSIGSSVIASNGRYFANGDLKQMSYGNGYAYSATQNARQLISSAQTVDGGVLAVKRNYSHDASGRVTSIIDLAVSGENRSFTYDEMGRLKTASGPWGAGSYIYDALGNLKGWTQGSRTHTTVWDTSKNRPTSATTTGYGTRGIGYDSRGNVTTLGGMSFTYDQANQAVSVSGTANGTYTYDGNFRRVKQAVNGETIYNVYSVVTGSIAVVDNMTTGEKNAIIDMGSASVRWNPSTGAEITHLDHLGSPVVATNWQGGIMWRESYTPFGEKLTAPAANRDKPSFTGHIDDGATGLTYMQARYYDPSLGRFLSSDPVGFMQKGPAYHNRYAYVGNNPVNAIDPDGEETRCSNDRSICWTVIDSDPPSGTRTYTSPSLGVTSTKTELGTDVIDTTAAEVAEVLDQQYGVERVYRVDVTEILGVTLVITSEIPTTNATALGASFSQSDLDGADAVFHTEPDALTGPLPGTGDGMVPAKVGIPNYALNGEHATAIELNNGRTQLRAIGGKQRNVSSTEYRKAARAIQRELKDSGLLN